MPPSSMRVSKHQHFATVALTAQIDVELDAVGSLGVLGLNCRCNFQPHWQWKKWDCTHGDNVGHLN